MRTEATRTSQHPHRSTTMLVPSSHGLKTSQPLLALVWSVRFPECAKRMLLTTARGQDPLPLAAAVAALEVLPHRSFKHVVCKCCDRRMLVMFGTKRCCIKFRPRAPLLLGPSIKPSQCRKDTEHEGVAYKDPMMSKVACPGNTTPRLDRFLDVGGSHVSAAYRSRGCCGQSSSCEVAVLPLLWRLTSGRSVRMGTVD